MLRSAIEACPEDLWVDTSYRNPFWHLAYHALFYTHLYLSPTEEEFEPWEKGRRGYNFFAGSDWAGDERVEAYLPYTREDILAYHALVHQRVPEFVAASSLDGPSGFEWIPFDRFQLHLYNIRHLGHHTGQLIDRVRQATGSGINWVGRWSDT